MYDPSIGRFLSEDPIDLEGGDPNLYRYVGNNPLNHTDPTGLQRELPVEGIMPGPIRSEGRLPRGLSPLPPVPKQRMGILNPDGTTNIMLRSGRIESIFIHPEFRSPGWITYYLELSYKGKEDYALIGNDRMVDWILERRIRPVFPSREGIPPPRRLITQASIPPSADGSQGFCFGLEGFQIESVSIQSMTLSSNAPLEVQGAFVFVTRTQVQSQIMAQSRGMDRYEFKSLPPGHVCDDARKVTYSEETITIPFKNQRFYPVEGQPWWVDITGSITVDLSKGKGWIAPSKKADGDK